MAGSHKPRKRRPRDIQMLRGVRGGNQIFVLLHRLFSEMQKGGFQSPCHKVFEIRPFKDEDRNTEPYPAGFGRTRHAIAGLPPLSAWSDGSEFRPEQRVSYSTVKRSITHGTHICQDPPQRENRG